MGRRDYCNYSIANNVFVPTHLRSDNANRGRWRTVYVGNCALACIIEVGFCFLSFCLRSVADPCMQNKVNCVGLELEDHLR